MLLQSTRMLYSSTQHLDCGKYAYTRVFIAHRNATVRDQWTGSFCDVYNSADQSATTASRRGVIGWGRHPKQTDKEQWKKKERNNGERKRKKYIYSNIRISSKPSAPPALGLKNLKRDKSYEPGCNKTGGSDNTGQGIQNTVNKKEMSLTNRLSRTNTYLEQNR